MLGYRSNDAVITVCQNNQAKSIEIIDLNEAAATSLGYAKTELAGRSFSSIIPMRLSTLLIEYVEYEDDAHDAGTVLSRMQSFSLVTKEKKEKRFHLKVVRGESTKDRISFQLVLQDAIDARKDNALYDLIQTNFKGHEILHPLLQIPNLASLEKDIDLTIYYHHKAQLRASLVLLQPDHLASLEHQYGETQRTDMLKHIVQVCRSNLRPGDVVATASDTQLGILLLDAVSDSTRMVANRLRWQIAAHPFALSDTSPLNLSASIAYANIDGALPAKELVAACKQSLAGLSPDETNQLMETAL
ncbi:MAG: diguanylate cyclase [Alphaproteobacteria bacterium]|nr:diguanylate cyclase [Alphaproteobacteria bacterium]